MTVYLDSNIVIYLVERPINFGGRASDWFMAAQARGDRFVVSDLTRVECRSQPLALGDMTTLQDYDTFFSALAPDIVPLTTAVCDRATEVRGFFRFKTPDALHLAAAVEAGCDRFLTNDLRLASFPQLTVEVLP